MVKNSQRGFTSMKRLMTIASALFVALVLLAGLAVGGVLAQDYTIYWGDIHGHTSYSDDAYIIQKNMGLTPNPPVSAITYGKAALDFLSVTDHAEHTELYRDEKGNLILDGTGSPIPEWQGIINACLDREANDPLVVFIGFEFTKTGEDADGNDIEGSGHKCVLFKGSGVPSAPISSVRGEPTADAPFCDKPTDLWSLLDAGGYDYITIPHHPAKGTSAVISPETDMSTDWDYVNSSRQQLVEIFSVHGSSDYSGCIDAVGGFRNERSVESALNLWLTTGNSGYALGIIASTDNHLSKPGSVDENENNMVHQEGDYTGGLIAALAPEKSGDAIWDALVSRRVYATTGPRIRINTFSVTAESVTYLMGQTVPLQGRESVPITIDLDVETDTADIDEIVITKSTIEDPSVQGKLSSGHPWITLTSASHALASLWSGRHAVLSVQDQVSSQRSYYRVTIYQKPTTRYTWTGLQYVNTLTRERAWSSPIFMDLTPPACPQCPGESGTLENVTFYSYSTCECVSDDPLTIGPGVKIESKAVVTFQAPVVKLIPGFKADSGAKVTILVH
ncbi:MAG: DUF3604 domain-containing protein [Pseudomonadota bacterium]